MHDKSNNYICNVIIYGLLDKNCRRLHVSNQCWWLHTTILHLRDHMSTFLEALFTFLVQSVESLTFEFHL